mgnify:CR=1 FL=1
MHNLALCIATTGTRTRIFTLLINTREIRVTFRIYNTFWPTVWWSSYVLRQARAHCLIIYILTLTIRTARGWSTYISFFFNCKVFNFMKLLSPYENGKKNWRSWEENLIFRWFFVYDVILWLEKSLKQYFNNWIIEKTYVLVNSISWNAEKNDNYKHYF